MTVEELRNECVARGLKDERLKKKLQTSLKEHLDKNMHDINLGKE